MSIASNVERFTIVRGLTRAQAWEIIRKKLLHDHRGFKYDPKTGQVVAT